MEASPRKAAAVAAVVAIVTAVSAVMSGATVLLTTATSLSQDMQKVRMKRKRREGELEERLIMKNLFAFRESPQRPLGPCADRFGRMTEDANRQYCKQLTHLYSWEISELANLMKAEIEKPRAATMKCREEKRPVKGGKGRPCKVSYVDRLLYVLEWLNTGDTVTRQEFTSSWSRSSCDEDRKHILKAICKVLDDQVRWPTEEERKAHYSTYNGVFVGCVGIFDVTEWVICKSKNAKFEHDTYSGKPGANTMKTLAVISKDGSYIWVDPLVKGRLNPLRQRT